jgi:hypothetical protein
MRAWIVAMMLLVPSAAFAQDPAPIELPEVHITASPPTPRVTILLPRSAPRFRRAEPEHHTVDRIVDSVRRAPF